jgi:hypothetical protein
MKKNLFVLYLLFSVSFSAFSQTATKKNSPAMKATAEITAKQMSDYLHFVASDEMEGRDTPSRGLDTTAKFIGMNLSRWGFKPAGDNGTYYQKIALVRGVTDAEKSTLEIGGEKFTYGNDFLRVSVGSTANVPLVYANDGWFYNSKDPYDGIDVKGKIVVVYADKRVPRLLTPPPVPLNELNMAERGKTWSDPVTYAASKGAVGVILINMATRSWDETKAGLAQPRLTPEKLARPGAANTLPVIYVTPRLGDLMFSADKNPTKAPAGEKKPAFEIGKSASINIAVKNETVYTQNVVALWEGSDPILKKEMVAIGAHYDHIGMSPNSSNPDKISNGADDDGSGTVAVLSIAEALGKSKIRPKRSILFVWHCGEEKGLWGSEYFNKFPTVDIKQVIAQLNIDMIGRSLDPNNITKCDKPGKPCDEELSGANAIYVIGSNMMSSKLGEIVANTNKAYLKMDYDFRFDDPKDPNQFFFRSDHFNYAVNGIPISFWFDGVHVDYHGVGDEPDKIDYVKMEKVTRTIFLTLWELGDLKERPKIDKELPKELTQR